MEIFVLWVQSKMFQVENGSNRQYSIHWRAHSRYACALFPNWISMSVAFQLCNFQNSTFCWTTQLLPPYSDYFTKTLAMDLNVGLVFIFKKRELGHFHSLFFHKCERVNTYSIDIQTRGFQTEIFTRIKTNHFETLTSL